MTRKRTSYLMLVEWDSAAWMDTRLVRMHGTARWPNATCGVDGLQPQDPCLPSLSLGEITMITTKPTREPESSPATVPLSQQ